MAATEWQELYFNKVVLNGHNVSLCSHKLNKNTYIVLGHAANCQGCRLNYPVHNSMIICNCSLCVIKK